MKKHLKIESSITSVRLVENAIDFITTEAGINQECYGKIIVATLEAVNNAIIHGNRYDKNKSVEIDIRLEGEALRVEVCDEGRGFRPQDVPDPTKPENIELVNGRGVFLMTHLADEIKYNDRGNCVTMKFKTS